MGQDFKLYVVWCPDGVGGEPQLHDWAAGRCGVYATRLTEVVAEMGFGFDSREEVEKAQEDVKSKFDWIIFTKILEGKR